MTRPVRFTNPINAVADESDARRFAFSCADAFASSVRNLHDGSVILLCEFFASSVRSRARISAALNDSFRHHTPAKTSSLDRDHPIQFSQTFINSWFTVQAGASSYSLARKSSKSASVATILTTLTPILPPCEASAHFRSFPPRFAECSGAELFGVVPMVWPSWWLRALTRRQRARTTLALM
jgi:hypothetical protein